MTEVHRGRTRSEGPSLNSHGREAVVTWLRIVSEVRRTGMIIPALSGLMTCRDPVPRPDGRGYYISALRASLPLNFVRERIILRFAKSGLAEKDQKKIKIGVRPSILRFSLRCGPRKGTNLIAVGATQGLTARTIRSPLKGSDSYFTPSA